MYFPRWRKLPAAPSPAKTPGPVVAVIPVIGAVIPRRAGINRAFDDFFLVVTLGGAARRRPRAHADVAADDEAVLAVHRGLAPAVGAFADLDGCSLRDQRDNLAVGAGRFPQIGFRRRCDRLGNRADR